MLHDGRPVVCNITQPKVKRAATAALLIAHRVPGQSLAFEGDSAGARAHYDKGIVLYDPAEHRPLATRFGQDARESILSSRSLALCLLGYPDAAFADADHALKDAREIGQAATLMHALFHGSFTQIYCGNHTAAYALVDELVALADEKGTLIWKALGMLARGWLFALTCKASDAVELINSGITKYRSTGATVFVPLTFAYLARAYAELGEFDDAWRCIGEAMTVAETTGERWCEAAARFKSTTRRRFTFETLFNNLS